MILEYNSFTPPKKSGQNVVQFVQATDGKVVGHAKVIDGYKKYCRVLAESAITATKEMAKFQLQNVL